MRLFFPIALHVDHMYKAIVTVASTSLINVSLGAGRFVLASFGY